MWKSSEILKSYIYEIKTKNSLRLNSQMFKKVDILSNSSREFSRKNLIVFDTMSNHIYNHMFMRRKN